MEELVKGDVVVIPFPFSDLSLTKKRPALVVANLAGDDIILAQITSAERFDEYSIPLSPEDFRMGGLPRPSKIRPNKLFTADKSIISYKIGSVTEIKFREVADKLVNIFKA